VGLYTLVGEDPRDLAARYRALQAWTPGGALDAVSLDAYREGRLVGTSEEVLAQLATFRDLGVEEMIVSASSLPFAVYDDSMLAVLAEAVIPRAHDL
jgi:alkanesulfonate monooxygenase SsuD/methylene tetrahydromethanopterin reductase-like flavin-dependent oxidoreductase (luciferase family)